MNDLYKIPEIKLQKMNLEKKDLDFILDSLICSEKVLSLILYGSKLYGDVNSKSDIDLLMILDSIDVPLSSLIAKNKRKIEEKLGVEVSLNIHTKNELNPLHKKRNIFIHKNRCEIFILKNKYLNKVIYGEDFLEDFLDPTPKEVREEAIKALSSFSYFLKKFVFNPELAPHGAKEFIRSPLISLEYIALFYGYIAPTQKDAYNFLSKNKLIENKFDNLCFNFLSKKAIGNYDISLEKMIDIINIIDYQKEKLIDIHFKRGMSDIRIINKEIVSNNNLSYPQAVVMNIVSRGGEILLMKRTNDDYLYPEAWTLLGGYIGKDENPKDAAKRELLEESSLDKNPLPLFNGIPVISERVGAFCFEINIGKEPIRISEHQAFDFVNIENILDRNLTPETRLILDKYLNQ